MPHVKHASGNKVQESKQPSPAKKQPENVVSDKRNRLDSDPIYGDAKGDENPKTGS